MGGPRARRDAVEAQRLGDELLLYDGQRDSAVCLQPAAALVWRHADGTRSREQLAALLAEQLALEDAPAWVEAALDELERSGLLEERGEAAPPTGLTRRALLGRLGAAAAVPLVLSVLAPTPAMAASSGAPCLVDSDCNSNKCLGANPRKGQYGVCR